MDDIVTVSPPIPLRVLRRVLPAAIGIVLLVGLGGGIRLAFSLNQPFPGIAMSWRKEIKLLTVSWTTPPHWPGIAAGLEIDDRILCIDGYLPKPDSVVYGLRPEHTTARCPKGGKHFAQVFREQFAAGRSVQILVERDGSLLTISDVPLVRFTGTMLLEAFLPAFLAGVGLLALASVVYRASPDAEMNLLFALFTTIIAGLAMDQGYMSIFSDRIENARGIALLAAVPWMPLLGAVFFHLVGLLTKRQGLVRRLRLPYYLLSIAFSILGIVVFIWHEHPISYALTPLLIYYVAASCVLSALCGLTMLAWAWRHADSKRMRRQMSLIFAGLFVAVGMMIPYLVLLFANAPSFSHIALVPYLGLIILAAFAYAILRYQLFVSKATILTTLLVSVLCILTAMLVYLSLGRATGFFPILVAALATGWTLEARRGPSMFLNRLLRRETLDYQTVARFSQRVGELQEIRALLKAARESFQQDLDVTRFDVWLLNQEQHAADYFRDGEPSGIVSIPPGLVGHLLAWPFPVHASSAPAADYAPLVAGAGPDSAVAWAPLVDQGQPVGLLGIGPRWTGEVYDDQDLQLVGILARQLALAIQNTRQFERMQATTHLILQAEENERLKIARELHDTILQFLLVLTYGLDELREQPALAPAEIERWQDRISAEAGQLRSMLSYLRAPEVLVQNGLVPSLHAWIDQVRPGAQVTIQADLSAEAEQALSVDAQVAIYRVFREAIHNALKHSDCERIIVQLRRDDPLISFSVEDNGRGFDTSAALQGNGRGYSSLQDMHTYVEKVGGSLTVGSAPGEGTRVVGTIPISP